MKPPKSKMAELAANASGGEKSHAETAESAEFKMTELGPIPVDWEVKRLGEIFAFKNGYNASANCYGSGMPVASVLDALSNRPLLRQSIDTKVNAPYKDQDSFSLKFGDLIFTRSSETLEDVGRSNVYLDEGNVMFGGFVIRGRPSVLIDSLFVNYMLNTSPCRIRVMSHGAGAQHFNIGQSGLEKVLIPLPPLAEQRRIARALSDVDELISALGKLIEKKRNIKTGAMQQLLTGKTRLPGFKGKWVERRLGECGFCFNGITGKSGGDFGHGRSRYITFLNVLTNVVINSSIFGPVDICSGENQNEVRRGDVFFNTSSETPEEVGLCAVLEDDVKSVYLNSFCFGFRLTDEDVCGRFLAYWFRSSTGRALMTSLAQGSTRYNLSKDAFREAYVCIPPTFAEQRAIATVLSDIDAEIAALEADRAKYERIKSGMMQELLTGRTRLKGE